MVWSITFVVMCGDPLDGFVLYGPFDTEEAAADYAEHQLAEAVSPWWISEMRQELDPNSIRKDSV